MCELRYTWATLLLFCTAVFFSPGSQGSTSCRLGMFLCSKYHHQLEITVCTSRLRTGLPIKDRGSGLKNTAEERVSSSWWDEQSGAREEYHGWICVKEIISIWKDTVPQNSLIYKDIKQNQQERYNNHIGWCSASVLVQTATRNLKRSTLVSGL